MIGSNAGDGGGDKRRDMTQGVGLSVGATNVAAVVPGCAAATRQSVLTLYRHRPPEVGVPAENPRLDERGLVVTGFVARAGDPVGIVAADGSFHRGEVLVSDALRALTYTVTGGRTPVTVPGVTFPAHWHAARADALRRALASFPEWSAAAKPLTLISDAAAALTALQAEPGLPTRGVVALCDFGGSGTNITLADAADGYRPIGATVRHAEVSGDLVDRALLAHLIADLSIAGTADLAGTAAIGSLHRLREQCRGAKERLSRGAATTLPADVPGFRGDIRLTRSELDEEIRQPITAFIEVLRELLFRNRIHPADLAGVASVGGGASSSFASGFTRPAATAASTAAMWTSPEGGPPVPGGGRCPGRGRKPDGRRLGGAVRHTARAGLVGGRRRFRHSAKRTVFRHFHRSARSPTRNTVRARRTGSHRDGG